MYHGRVGHQHHALHLFASRALHAAMSHLSYDHMLHHERLHAARADWGAWGDGACPQVPAPHATSHASTPRPPRGWQSPPQLEPDLQAPWPGMTLSPDAVLRGHFGDVQAVSWLSYSHLYTGCVTDARVDFALSDGSTRWRHPRWPCTRAQRANEPCQRAWQEAPR